MIIEKLEYFYVIAKYNSLSKAAKELHVSVSSLSTALKSLENELGYPLFTRIGRKLQLNKQGQNILPSISKIMTEAQKIQLPLCDSIANPTIKIGTSSSSFIFKYSQFASYSKQVLPKFSYDSTLSLFNQLLQHNLDFVISSSIIDSSEFDQQLLTTLDFKIAISKKQIPPNKHVLSTQELNQFTFLLMNDHPSQCEITHKIADLLKINPHYIYCPDSLGLYKLIDSGQGVALLTSLEQELLDTHSVDFLPLPIPYTINFYLYQSSQWPLSCQASAVKKQLLSLFCDQD